MRLVSQVSTITGRPCLPKSSQEVGVEGSLEQWAETTDGSHKPAGLEESRPAMCGPLLLS